MLTIPGKRRCCATWSLVPGRSSPPASTGRATGVSPTSAACVSGVNLRVGFRLLSSFWGTGSSAESLRSWRAHETGSIVRVSGSSVFCHLRVWTERPRHLDAFGRIVVDVFGGNHLGGRRALLHPTFESGERIMLRIIGWGIAKLPEETGSWAAGAVLHSWRKEQTSPCHAGPFSSPRCRNSQ